ncbi:MAG: DUF1549 domain-containing protein [Verrucomicrobiales bacterium]|nr:DUF1549 domain-containing protein [Verrucomicrobiales bacterium]
MKHLPVIYLLSIPFLLLGDNSGELKFFENKVRPLLAAECYDCHGPEKAKGGLRLDHISHIKKGGDSGPALVAGDVKASLLIEAVHRSDPDFAMPPKKELDGAQVAILEQWIKSGAVWPEEVPKTGEIDEFGFTKEDYQWWAIQPVRDPAPPQKGGEWANNAIDRFIVAKLDEAGLQPAPEASREELVRRAYLDLHGLPPTPEQVAAFLADKRPDAWQRLIDELLASPAYGERWAQHWLDVVRYAESDGYRADGYRSETWRYRDYVIDSLNEDKPYDQFIREQLAGDEIAPDDPDTLVATGFLRLGIYEWNQRNARMHWDLIMTEMTNATAEAFLGIGIGCAQCHDHKFDPILQKDHFALQAFLNSVWWPEHHLLGSDEQMAQQKVWEKATAEVRGKLEELKRSKVEGHIKWVVKQFPADIQEIYWKPQAERNAYEEQLAQLVQRQVDHKARGTKWEKEFEKDKEKLARYKELNAELAKFDHLKPKEKIPNGFISTDVKPTPADTLLEKRGKKNVVEPAFLTLLGQPAPKIEPTGSTTGRRTALADWIADPGNPLSTRVIVNRLWQRHFASGLAPSPNDFGKLGGKPSHPELLDWLTSRFLEGGWKMKSIHRLIMTSATYRQTSRYEPTSVERITDPTNQLLWRYPPKRLQAEQLRDAMLAVSGELSSKIGGSAQSGTSTVRSVYTQKKRNSPDAFLAGFDAPAGFGSTPNRIPTTTPNQSLLLVNGPWAIARAKSFAQRILNGKSSVDAGVIQTAFQRAYGRDATSDEVAASIEFIQQQSGVVTGPDGPEPKYPGENGLRDLSGQFSEVKELALGSKALWLQPGSRFEQLDFSRLELPEDAFTIEAVANLDSVYKDASVNTLVSKWNGSRETDGWSFGVTSAKSAYQPRNFIMQLVGENFQGNQIYEVVASDLFFPLQTPVYFAATVSAVPTDGDATSGKVTFYMKDLSSPGSKLQKSAVTHSVTGGISKQNLKSFIGGRNGRGHLWDGQLARLKISEGTLSDNELFINKGSSKAIVDWDFSSKNGEEPAPGTSWYRQPVPGKPDSKLLSATTDFCHALLNSNEFIYQH